MRARVRDSWMVLGALFSAAVMSGCDSSIVHDTVVVRSSPTVIDVTPSPAASTSPQPVTSPAPSPTPAISASATTLAFGGIGASFAQPLTISEAMFTGSFTESDTCAAIATIATGSTAGPSATYAVTPVGAGTCLATFSGSPGAHVIVSIAVNSTGVVVQ